MILAAFLLVVLAAVMLVVGTLLDGGTLYIMLSIAACLATFVVLGMGYVTRRRGTQEKARTRAALSAGQAQDEPSSPRPSAAATPARVPTPAGPPIAEPSGPLVGTAPAGGDEVQDAALTDEEQQGPRGRIVARRPAADAVPAQAPTGGSAADDEPVEEPEPVQGPEPVADPGPVAEGPLEAPASEESTGASTSAGRDPATERGPVTEAPRRVRRVVRRRASTPGTRVERTSAAPTSHTGADDEAASSTRTVVVRRGDGTRQVVRRVERPPDRPTRVVRRVVRATPPTDR